jgi:hypothetical protein
MIERKPIIGGICVNVGTIPSKTMREAILYLSGYREHAAYGDSYRVKEKITFQDLLARIDPVVRNEIDVLRHQLSRNGVELVNASASFIDPHAAARRQAERTVKTDYGWHDRAGGRHSGGPRRADSVGRPVHLFQRRCYRAGRAPAYARGDWRGRDRL